MAKVFYLPSLLPTEEASYAYFDDGLTLAEIITGKCAPAPEEFTFLVDVEDSRIPREMWHLVTPKKGTSVVVRPTVMGDEVTSVLVAVAVVVGALLLGPVVGAALLPFLAASTSAAIGTALVGAVGSLLIGALAPPAEPQKLQQLSGQQVSYKSSQNYAISGAANLLQPFGVIPVVLGRHRIVPPLGARTITELRGSKYYFRMLVIWGYGRLDISNVKIGETPLSFYDNYTIQTRQGGDGDLSVFPEQIVEDELSILLRKASSWQQLTTEPDTDEISLDFAMPNGFYILDPKTGKKDKADVTLEIQYRRTSTSSWTNRPDYRIRNRYLEGTARNTSWNVSRGQYHVRVRRATNEGNQYQIDKIYWSKLRSIKHQDPILFPKTLSKSALLIKASEQLNGRLDDLNAIAHSYASVWNSGTESWTGSTQTTSNPAALMRLVLTGPYLSRPYTDDSLWLDELGEWYEFCEERNLEFNMVIDFETTLGEVLNMICAAGMATYDIRDGKWTVIIDKPKSVIAAHFSKQNTRNYEGEINYITLPHAFRVRFVNKASNIYRQDERIVYRAGYNVSNATLYESMDLPGVTSAAQAYQLAIRHMATAILRPQQHSFETGIQNLRITRGDRIKFTHDAPQFGVGDGWIKQVNVSGGFVENIVIDNGMPMEDGTNYAMRVQRYDGSTQLIRIVTAPGYQTTLIPYDTIEEEDAPEKGDLFLFGIFESEAADLLVLGIQGLDDLNARVICTDYSPEIYDVDSNVIPEYNSQITIPPKVGIQPPTPQIVSVQSDISVASRASDGSINEKVLITVTPPAGYDPSEVFLEGQARIEEGDDWTEIVTQNRNDRVEITPVVGGEVFDLRVRFKTSAASQTPGAVSPWTEVNDYLVIGKTDLPPDVTELKMEGPRATWTLNEPPLDLAGFELRVARGTRVVWDNARVAQTNLITTTEFDMSWLSGGTFTIMVKAVDSGGRYSQNADAMVVNLGDDVFGNVFKTVDFQANGYNLEDDEPATVTQGSIIEGQLRADVTEGFWSDTGDAPFWNLDGPLAGDEMFWQDSAKQMTYESFYVPLVGEIGSTMGLEYSIEATDVILSYRTDGDALFFNGQDAQLVFTGDDDAEVLQELGAWRVWPGKLDIRGRERYYLQVITTAGVIRGIIDEFTVKVDVPDIFEDFIDVDIDSAGSRITPTLTYDVIKSISLSVQDDSGDGAFAKVLDKDPELGPLVKVFDLSGDPVNGRVSGRMVGYNV